ncbi:helix-turn-helix transcriptional regulator [Nocardia otitidiscaviarum]|uniref:helix-turn-helix transcriptional regulator n=1 Tax=Nocardia otitidiscaviarum TaxID=1823 RepID=UPI00189479D4|nr:helix-turn-helix transcriptional regulator [Nocardia otitidiscaviarum]
MKALVKQRKWTYAQFAVEYDQAAALVAPELVGWAPALRTIRRWLAGTVRPRPENCRVLEAMFPGYTVDELTASCDLAVGPPTREPERRPARPVANPAVMAEQSVRPARLSFAGVCIWCNLLGCVDPICVQLHQESRWKPCGHCEGAPWLHPGECTCVFGLTEVDPVECMAVA